MDENLLAASTIFLSFRIEMMYASSLLRFLAESFLKPQSGVKIMQSS